MQLTIPADTEARSYAEGKNDELTFIKFKSAQPMPEAFLKCQLFGIAKTMLFDAVSGKKMP